MTQNEEMDSKTRLMKALAAGAAADLRPNLMGRHESQNEIAEATQTLKKMIQRQYPQVDIDLLDIGPGSAERQSAVAEQIQAAGAAEDEAILRQAQVVLDIIGDEEPEALWAAKPAESPPQHK